MSMNINNYMSSVQFPGTQPFSVNNQLPTANVMLGTTLLSVFAQLFQDYVNQEPQMSTNLYLKAAQLFPSTPVQMQSEPSVFSSGEAAASNAALPAQKTKRQRPFLRMYKRSLQKQLHATSWILNLFVLLLNKNQTLIHLPKVL